MIPSSKTDGGFSLVEMVTVVAIMSALTALAVPKFQIFTARAKQSEAKSGLAHVVTLQHLHYTDTEAFGTLSQIGFTSAGYIHYGFGTTTGSTFVATATGIKPLCTGTTDIDIWTIDENGVLSNTTDGVANC